MAPEHTFRARAVRHGSRNRRASGHASGRCELHRSLRVRQRLGPGLCSGVRRRGGPRCRRRKRRPGGIRLPETSHSRSATPGRRASSPDRIGLIRTEADLCNRPVLAGCSLLPTPPIVALRTPCGFRLDRAGCRGAGGLDATPGRVPQRAWSPLVNGSLQACVQSAACFKGQGPHHDAGCVVIDCGKTDGVVAHPKKAKAERSALRGVD